MSKAQSVYCNLLWTAEGGLRTEPGLCQKVSSGQSRAEAQEQGSVNKNTANETLARGAERAQFYFVFAH